MSERITCPIPEYDAKDKQGNPVYYVDMPDDFKFLGLHAQRRDEVLESVNGLGSTLTTFCVALALLDGWHLPGLSMEQVQNQEVGEVDLEVITWVNNTVIRPFKRATEVPKGFSVPSSVLTRMARQNLESGSSEEEE